MSLCDTGTAYREPSPPVCFSIPIEDDLQLRLNYYVTTCDVNRDILARRLFNDSLRRFLDEHAPLNYPVVGQDV